MAHEIDITNGRAAAVFARESAWHQLGQTLDDAFTAETAMEQGLLGGWNVRLQPLYVGNPGGVLFPDKHGVVRTNPVTSRIEPLGVVGGRYTVIQNEEHAQFLNNLVDESGAHFETAGSLYGGRVVFLTMKVPTHIMIGGVDPVELYLAAINSHDGSMPFTIVATPVRVVCANTLSLALQAGATSPRVKIRHTRNASMRIGEARRTLDLSFRYVDEFSELADRMINETLEYDAFLDIVEREFTTETDHAPSMARSERKVTEIMDLFDTADTQEGMRNTVWAGFNALTEWADHYSPSHGTDRDTARALRAVMEPEFKQKAMRVMGALVS